MKKPNDIKRPNSKSGSLGQLYRRLERFIHITRSFHKEQVTDEKTGIVTEVVVPDQPYPIQYRPNKKPDAGPQPIEVHPAL